MRLRLPERLLACLFRHLVAALAVLLLFKLALVLTMAAGAEGPVSRPSLAAKSLLLFGNDVLGGILVASIATLLSWPLVASGRERLSAAAGGTVQALHGTLVAVSFFTSLYLGGPLNREVIELSALAGGRPKMRCGDAKRALVCPRHLHTQPRPSGRSARGPAGRPNSFDKI